MATLERRLSTEVHGLEELREELAGARREAALAGQKARVRELRLREKLEAALLEADRRQARAAAAAEEEQEQELGEEGNEETVGAEAGPIAAQNIGSKEVRGAGTRGRDVDDVKLWERDLRVSGERALLQEASARGMVLSAQVRALEGQLSNEREVGTSLTDKLLEMQQQIDEADADRGKARRTAEDARTAARMAEEALMRALGERDVARRQLQERDDQTADLQEQLLRVREELKFPKLQRFNEYRENEGSGNRKLPCF